MREARRSPHSGLPTPADLFVGRDGELAAVSGMLANAQARLVTLTGPPGIGKTRLAVVCASAYAKRSECAAVFVDLAPVRDQALVVVELAQALGVEPRSGADLTGQLAAALGNEERLVVLDNFEHLLAAAPDVGQVRARLPDETGYAANSGVRIHYEVHGTGQPTLLLLPTWAIVDSRHWKMQVPFLARNYRVITFDPRGNGRSDRPRDPAAYADAAFASDIQAVLDATGTERAVLGAFCSGFPWALLFAAAHPQRVTGIITIGPTLPIPPADPWDGCSFDDVSETTEGWAKENRH